MCYNYNIHNVINVLKLLTSVISIKCGYYSLLESIHK